ncbi:TPA: hypothetical protein ON570_004906 [Citrobacter werkmanii]|nr:hypothetical protein [Citrobacter werkmanii]
MSEFRRWRGETLKPDKYSVGSVLRTVLTWLTGSLAAVVLVLLLLMYG